jgi:8-oxo-dGTP diphosphatase
VAGPVAISSWSTLGEVVLDQHCLAGQLVAGRKVTAVDGSAQVVGDLPVRRPVVGAVNGPELHDSSRRLDIYHRCRTLPNGDARQEATVADTPKHSVSVAGIVVDATGRVLVIQRRDNGRWEPPGGVLEAEETPEEGVCREVLEETGVVVQVERLSGVYKNMQLGVVALVFRCRALAGESSPKNESSQVTWVTTDQVQDLMAPAYAVRVFDALDDSTVTPVRVHDGYALLASSLS